MTQAICPRCGITVSFESTKGKTDMRCACGHAFRAVSARAIPRKKSRALERNAVKKIMEALRERGCMVRKRHGTVFVIAGDPDLYGSLPGGRHFELEVKREGELPDKLQLARLREWAEMGAIVGVATSVEEALDVLGLPATVPDPAKHAPGWIPGARQTSSCHGAPYIVTRSDGVITGSCAVCGRIEVRIHPMTGKAQVAK